MVWLMARGRLEQEFESSISTRVSHALAILAALHQPAEKHAYLESILAENPNTSKLVL